MIRFLFILCSFLTTDEEIEAARSHWSGPAIGERKRIYCREIGRNGFFFDTSTIAVADGNRWVFDTLTCFHFSGGGPLAELGYDDCIWFGTIRGRFHLFAWDHAVPWDGKPKEIRRGGAP